MKHLQQFFRLVLINRVLVRHGLDEIVLATHLLRPLRYLLMLLPWNWISRNKGPRGQRIREALEDLGPIFIKFGQMLSTRRDLLPKDIAEELAQLQ
ncbi:MAG: ubiquinone biosynthesis regulatory protein kinase UbiB, partial [Gammaproteobacteria bacterium]|nr:ubiquinone biosynthesis regulatory protein kinase UbiB [Gammaproteobacteria bacterium]